MVWRTLLKVYFEGIMHNSIVYLNGRRLGAHGNGYTQSWYRLDGHGLVYGGANILAVSADAYAGEGMWYGGGGLYRHQRLVHTAAKVYMPPDDTWVHANVSKSEVVPNGALPSDGDAAANVLITTEVLLANTAAAAAAAAGQAAGANVNVIVGVQIVDSAAGGSGAIVATATTSNPIPLGAGKNQTATLTISTPPVSAATNSGGGGGGGRDASTSMIQLWSVARPYLYTAVITVSTVTGGADSSDAVVAAVDTQNITFGVRKVVLDPDAGMLLNDRKVKVRGFCDHSSFGGVGAAVPERVNLYRAQVIRGVGGNAWRMASLTTLSHTSYRESARARTLLGCFTPPLRPWKGQSNPSATLWVR